MHSTHLPVSAARAIAQDLDRPPTRASNTDLPEHSLHMRSRSIALAQTPRRLSVFSGRSRSNTTTSTTPSTTSSRRSPASSMTSNDTASLPPAHEDRTASAAAMRHERQESVTKSLLLRGSRILRRQGSKFNIVATLDEEEELERDKSRFEVFGRHHKSRFNDSHEQMKRLISDPFDFHHLTHTSPAQFHALDQTQQNDLVTEFSAIRASQKPVANLKGIRADDLHFRGFSSEDLTGSETGQDNATPFPPVSPPASPGGSSSISPKQPDNRPRDSRTFENFSRPVPRYPRTEPSASPPRASSPTLASSPEIPEPAPRAIDEILGLTSQPTYPEHVYSTDDEYEHSASLATTLPFEGMFQSSPGHAVTTGPGAEPADPRTRSSLTSPSSELEDVPEEEEATHWHDSPPPLQSAEGMHFRTSSGLDSFTFQPVETQPPGNTAPRTHRSIHVAKELSMKFSEALGSPTLPQSRAEQETPVDDKQRPEALPIRRQSSLSRRAIHETIYESWDDDIDYCYEHAAESNSNFDWTRTSLDESRKAAVEVTVTASDLDVASTQSRMMRPLTHPLHLGPSVLSTPELAPSPSRSLPSSRLAVTPSTTGYEGEFVAQRDGDYFQPVSSSVFPGTLAKHMNPDVLYEEYLAADAESDRHFSFCSQGGFQAIEHPVSPRSSFSPISKCNSQESLILSRAASIVRKHRSSVSTASVPELVHSLASSRDFSTTDSMLSVDHAGLVRPDSSSHHHRQTKSLAREIESQVMSRMDHNGSTEFTRLGSSIVLPAHDRTKSTSDGESVPILSRPPLKPEPPMKSTHRRKGRTSYSLFPSPATANP
ncbi:hypothetical protein P175DRAFT_0526277 [Aspergillus ochraceoroseus IBT 24754]|uniref:CRIB domain-containing protein n=2 Tax=Aspergillus ochraceoroseus TaxID=138278 RepID=A0A2T5LN84_9EURO|nr:uncharacterized protein P175DRAFT_0526277 [Aspergillus ochraceoroseus IBT 24754]KKK18097.1 hypothetical protein AOCH_006960 [Aspergillus ochraceoroseus]PTU17736.1 hypothetical protein P175DRAFT_0526277 [Aspergillus ochraceoroseus IBT 24754]